MQNSPRYVDFTKCPRPRLNDAIAWSSGQPGSAGFIELLKATAAGRIGLTAILHHKVNWTPHCLTTRLPIIVLLGDDKGDSRDPSAWRCSMSAIAWARSALIHGCGAEAWHYQQAILAAEITGRCLFVETDSDHVAAWVSAIAPRGMPGLSIIPRPGQKHPAEPARGHA